MTQDVAAARVDFPTNDPTNPLHRLAGDIKIGRIIPWSPTAADVEYAIARVAALEEGMRPFAAIAEVGDQRPKDDAVWAGQDSVSLTFGDFRRARYLLANPQDERGRE